MSVSRRSFLAAAAGVVPATTVAAPVVQPVRRDRTPTGLRLGTVTYNIAAAWDIDTIIARLTEIGIEGVELRTTHAHGVEPHLGPTQRADVRKRFENSPIRLAGLGSFQGFCFAEIPESADPVRVLKYFRGMFRAYQNII